MNSGGCGCGVKGRETEDDEAEEEESSGRGREEGPGPDPLGLRRAPLALAALGNANTSQGMGELISSAHAHRAFHVPKRIYSGIPYNIAPLPSSPHSSFALLPSFSSI